VTKATDFVSAMQRSWTDVTGGTRDVEAWDR
jgi:hypothetical protein